LRAEAGGFFGQLILRRPVGDEPDHAAGLI
jgi:hypothetical protein